MFFVFVLRAVFVWVLLCIGSAIGVAGGVCLQQLVLDGALLLSGGVRLVWQAVRVLCRRCVLVLRAMLLCTYGTKVTGALMRSGGVFGRTWRHVTTVLWYLFWFL